ncbi:aldehyde dehydrogenase family protein [Aliidiomarina quisquiliarum]|uniref:aldehyde dehydrogenase family protein n=1 Tax=Aliidiomarina quisquiliarum TaxID=2938947 RepID=UPI00208F0E6F|nr:aldehyde dehydrogenase family protein [Aliidiomarina quisquiliarum]MCO4321948.1 aldehyde dehydrogenase family protein [Aliidiomarina quisquiliarum]
MNTPATQVQQTHERLFLSFLSHKTMPLQWRRHQLEQLALMLREHEGKFAAALADDLGKSATEAWVTEIGFLLNDIHHNIKNLTKWAKPRRVRSPLAMQPARSKLTPSPLGVVLVMGAWNYPLQLTLGPAIAAIAAGNCVYLKPSEVSPATAAVLAKLLPQYVDNDCIQLIEGDASVASELLALPFNHIFYTGGGKVGKIVMRAAAEHLTPVSLELGGKSPVIVSRYTDLKATARRIVWGKFINAGQTCIAPDYILVEEQVHEPLVAALQEAIRQFYGDDPENSNDYGRIVATRHVERLAQLIEPESLTGATIYGGDYDRETRYFAPTIVSHCPPDSKLMTEEIFGPILPIVVAPDLPSAFAFVRSRPHPLACYLFSQDITEQQQAEQFIQCGSLCINDTIVFMLNPALPFGGVGPSGMGRYHGKWGFDTFSHLKPVVTRSFKLDLDVRYPPFTNFKTKLLKKLLG